MPVWSHQSAEDHESDNGEQDGTEDGDDTRSAVGGRFRCSGWGDRSALPSVPTLAICRRHQVSHSGQYVFDRLGEAAPLPSVTCGMDDSSLHACLETGAQVSAEVEVQLLTINHGDNEKTPLWITLCGTLGCHGPRLGAFCQQ